MYTDYTGLIYTHTSERGREKESKNALPGQLFSRENAMEINIIFTQTHTQFHCG